MLDITVKVPSERLADFYSMYGQWLATGGTGGPGSEGGKGAPEPWGSSDEELARKVWGKLSDSAKALFSILIDAPGREFSGDELAERLGMSGKNAVAGLLGWPGRHCIEAGREWLWDWRYPDGKTVVYWLTPEMAELLRSVRDSR
ncbi:DUF6416 domain-containing protein [Micromonospora sp. NPDC007230]|uniref:DUF6416 domain-containing protein n=1 Tax=Micromonospora sp. NPDC007230 TaxID=3364237 RepID=UPI00368D45CF